MTLTAWPYPLWIAHRGAGKLAPENTLAAFRLGAQHGYTAFECDVKLSADDVPFLLHDAALARTTRVDGIAGERLWAELSLLDAGGWHSRRYAGEPLATLAALAHYMRRNRFALNIEIKPTPGQETQTGERVAEAAALLWQGHSPAPLLSSFQPAALEAARRAAPALPRALLLDEAHPGWLDGAQGLGCVAVWLLSGRMLYEYGTALGTMIAHVAEPVPDLTKLVAGELPPSLHRILLQCLSKSPDDRPKDARALAEQLRSVRLAPDDEWTPERARAWWSQYMPQAQGKHIEHLRADVARK